MTCTTHHFDPDLFNAVLLQAMGITGAPRADMPAWEFDALAFAQANDLHQFHNTIEYREAELIGHVLHAFHWSFA